jgi:hypothetical protein
MLLPSPEVSEAEFTARTGWHLRPEGACKGDVCVPLADSVRTGDGLLDVRELARAMRLPLEHDETHGIWALGPESGAKALTTTRAPELALPDVVTGEEFTLSSRLGRKVVLVAWASW